MRVIPVMLLRRNCRLFLLINLLLLSFLGVVEVQEAIGGAQAVASFLHKEPFLSPSCLGLLE